MAKGPYEIYEPVIQKLAIMLSSSPEDAPGKQEYFKVIFDQKTMVASIVQNLNERFSDAQSYELAWPRDIAPGMFSGKSVYTQPLQSCPSGGRLSERFRVQHPLTQTEIDLIETSHKDEKSHMDQAFNALQGMVGLYFDDLTAALKASDLIPHKDLVKTLPMRPRSSSSLLDLVAFLKSEIKQNNDFKNVLSAVITTTLEPGQPVNGRSTLRGVKKLFDRCAFTSVIERGNPDSLMYSRTNKSCPFGQIFGALWNAEIVENEDGQFAYTGRQKAGGFFDAFQARVARESLGPAENLKPQSQGPQ